MSSEQRDIEIRVKVNVEDVDTTQIELSDEAKKEEVEKTETFAKVRDFDEGNVGDVQRFTTQQFGNVRSLAQNPLLFFLGFIGRTVGKAGTVVGLALLIFPIVETIINFLMKPGRDLDRRFRRIASREINFALDIQTQEEIRFGIKTIIVTTRPYLRGGAGQIGGNLYRPAQSVGSNFYDTRITQQIFFNARPQGKSRSLPQQNIRGGNFGP